VKAKVGQEPRDIAATLLDSISSSGVSRWALRRPRASSCRARQERPRIDFCSTNAMFQIESAVKFAAAFRHAQERFPT